jgi:hypothetical protein
MAINTRGVITGGLVAGLVINISETILNVPVAGAQMEAALKDRNLPPIGGGSIAFFVLMSFIVGIVMVWLYAAVRPRLGPGPKTAVIIGVMTWFLSYFFSGTGQLAMGLMPVSLTVLGLVWGLVELVLAAWVGARLYSEP